MAKPNEFPCLIIIIYRNAIDKKETEMNFRNRQRHQEENKFMSINKKVSALHTETLIIIKKKTKKHSFLQLNE
jgi:hypothetical protein